MTEVEFNDFVPNLLQMQMDGLFDEEEDEPIVKLEDFNTLALLQIVHAKNKLVLFFYLPPKIKHEF